MERISSKWTVMHKRISPMLYIVVALAMLVNALWTKAWGPGYGFWWLAFGLFNIVAVVSFRLATRRSGNRFAVRARHKEPAARFRVAHAGHRPSDGARLPGGHAPHNTPSRCSPAVRGCWRAPPRTPLPPSVRRAPLIGGSAVLVWSTAASLAVLGSALPPLLFLAGAFGSGFVAFALARFLRGQPLAGMLDVP
ncbi:MAG: hypothetical protein AAFX39_03855 [Pseudomonadota bacterium]